MLRKAFLTIAVGAAALTLGASSSKAVEIDFGSLAPSPGGCTHVNAADTGNVCANGQTFSANGSTFTATGYSVGFTTATDLTLKTPALGNSFAETGLGENDTGPGTACTDQSNPTNCEIDGGANPRSVAVVSNNPMNDVIIGSDQSGENWQLFTGSSIATLALFTSGTGGTASCNTVSGADTCTVTGFSALVVGLRSGGTGNVLLTAVSQPAAVTTPEPASLAILGSALLLGFGLVRRRRRS